MNARARMRVVYVITALAWAAMLIDVLPTGWLLDLPDDVARLDLTIAGVGAVVTALRATTRPVDEIYELGIEAGRRTAERQADEASPSGVIVPFRRRG